MFGRKKKDEMLYHFINFGGKKMFVVCQDSYLGKKRLLVLDMEKSRSGTPQFAILTPEGEYYTNTEKKSVQDKLAPYLFRKAANMSPEERDQLQVGLFRYQLPLEEYQLVLKAVNILWKWDGKGDIWSWMEET